MIYTIPRGLRASRIECQAWKAYLDMQTRAIAALPDLKLWAKLAAREWTLRARAQRISRSLDLRNDA